MIVVAHVGGLPVEETIAQLASVGIVVLVVARERTRRFRARLRGAERSFRHGSRPLGESTGKESM